MRGEFSAIRREIKGEIEDTKRTLREEMRGGFAALRSELKVEIEDTKRILREEIAIKIDDVMAQARTLHEDLVGRLEMVREGG